MRTFLGIWTWEQVSIMEKYKLDSFIGALMNSDLATMLNIDMHCVCVMNAILLYVIGSTFSVLVIVWWDNNNFLAEFSHSNRQFINHYT